MVYIYCVPGLEDSSLLTPVLPKLIYTFYTFLIEPIEMKKRITKGFWNGYISRPHDIWF